MSPRARPYDVQQADAVQSGTEGLGVFLLLKAFAGGSVALTGTEAIANGVPAFQPPRIAERRATRSLAMAILLGVLFIGITFVSDAYGIEPTTEGGRTVVALVVEHDLRRRLAGLLPVPGLDRADPVPGREHELQRLPPPRGTPRRSTATCLASSRSAATASPTRYGIVILAAVAAGLLIAFGGDTHALIPLYSVGVFVCFTLSQVGHGPALAAAIASRGWWYRASINGVGAVLTAVVLAVVTTVKFADGA